MGHFSLKVAIYFKRVIVTPAVYPSLNEFHHVDFQSTGQKSHCVNTFARHHNAMFLLNSWIPLVRFSSELIVNCRRYHMSGYGDLQTKVALDSLVADSVDKDNIPPDPQSQSLSRSYGSSLPNSLIYIILSTRGC